MWVDALGWAFLYPVVNLAAAVVLLLLVTFMGPVRILGILILVTTVFGILSFLFSNVRAPKLGVPRSRAALAYILVVLLSNAVYLPIAVGYAAIVHAL